MKHFIKSLLILFCTISTLAYSANAVRFDQNEKTQFLVQKIQTEQSKTLDALSKIYVKLYLDKEFHYWPSNLTANFFVAVQSTQKSFDRYIENKKNDEGLDSNKESFKEKCRKIFVRTFTKLAAEFYLHLERIGYRPPAGKSYVLSGCTGTDAVLELFALNIYFQQFPESSFEYISFEKHMPTIGLNKVVLHSAKFKNYKIRAGDITRTEKLIAELNIEPREVSLFLCCHPPIKMTQYGEGEFEFGIAKPLVAEMQKEIYNNTLRAVSVYFDSEEETLREILDVMHPSYEVVYKDDPNEQWGSHLRESDMSYFANIFNALRATFIIKPS